MGITAQCYKLIEAEVLQRSSHIVSVVDNQAVIFGGELQPREPRDNDVHSVSLDSATTTMNLQPATPEFPSARVGTASAVLNGKIYLFSGRGGIAMAPIDENGAIWEYDLSTKSWTFIQPSDIGSKKYPAARSYHCMTSDGKDTLYLHAGCPEKGRLGDLWAFKLLTKEWTELAPAFDPPRGGTSIAFADGKLYRMNGFDGETEQGGNLDIYTPETNSWDSHSYCADGKGGPTPRSVSTLLPISLGGRSYLVTMFGERDPSSLGHQGAGKMLSDVWAFDLGSKMWGQADLQGSELPLARGWFDADVAASDAIVVHGGLGESNERLGDIWRLEFA
ncbi:uncharacterized protein N7484_002041 [Penicillium longicatenatum]|uniref:uncharacterized protein n=1 Tax=Penicillium longicatenatum TaxID=1561947 RepID=UPI0025483189|nr:uncharacterized protein N7484_002041 [Penicillium longicatenatum]KAJ5658392.1 hypothetical protein N7484_002041 [Penicillium longicatenatum]